MISYQKGSVGWVAEGDTTHHLFSGCYLHQRDKDANRIIKEENYNREIHTVCSNCQRLGANTRAKSGPKTKWALPWISD